VNLLEFHRAKRQISAMRRDLMQPTRDLSQKASQKALLALEAANMGYWERDAETDIITFSPVLEEMLELDHETYDGSVDGWLKHVHPDDRQMIVDRIEEARCTGKNYTFKYRPLTSDGSERWITTTGTYRKDESGQFAGAHGVSWDSTASELAARKLSLSEQLFRVLSDAAPIGIFRTDMNGALIYANPSLGRYHQVPEQALLGFGWVRHIHPDDKDALMASIEEVTKARKPGEYEHRLLRDDGTVRWMHARTSPLWDQDGVFVGKVGTVDDITHQRQMLDDLQRAKNSAEVANRAKDMFLANVSHELRTPLNGVLGMSDLLLESGLKPDQFEMAEIVRDSARGLLSVVNDMLDLSRIEAGRFAIDRQPFNLHLIIQQSVAMFKAEARKKHINLVIKFGSNLAEWYIGDSGRVKQILTNYISNALKFTTSGEITVETCGELKDDVADITISVRDTGMGIEAENQKKLFQAFFQADSSSTRRNGGAGLGLAISKRLAELMNGSVGVISSPGQGSTFWVKLPLECHSNSAPAVRNVSAIRSSSGGTHILLVEDNPINQRVTLGFLRRLGWEVHIAENGLAAVELCKTKRFAVVLMDCQMPEMDGYAATRQIRDWEKSVELPPVPIVALTAHAMHGDKDRCLEAGMNDHLSKPFGLDELRATLDRWVMACSN
jgi:PAS domain S-box-containing protein